MRDAERPPGAAAPTLSAGPDAVGWKELLPWESPTRASSLGAHLHPLCFNLHSLPCKFLPWPHALRHRPESPAPWGVTLHPPALPSASSPGSPQPPASPALPSSQQPQRSRFFSGLSASNFPLEQGMVNGLPQEDSRTRHTQSSESHHSPPPPRREIWLERRSSI